MPDPTQTEPVTAVLETPRLRLREMTEDDFVRLHAMMQDPAMNATVGGPPPPLAEYLEQSRLRWEAHRQAHGFGLWAVFRREDGEMLGRCGPIVQTVDGSDEVEVGYAFAPEHWGRGYATEAARASLGWIFRTLGVPHVISLILPTNLRSIAVAERNGMTFWKMADFKGYHVRVYRITREEWERAPGPEAPSPS